MQDVDGKVIYDRRGVEIELGDTVVADRNSSGMRAGKVIGAKKQVKVLVADNEEIWFDRHYIIKVNGLPFSPHNRVYNP